MTVKNVFIQAVLFDERQVDDHLMRFAALIQHE
jgi:hypothetical protein